MFDDYEFYQGGALHKLLATADGPLTIRPFKSRGRTNAFVLNEHVAIFLKHSSKRLSPWIFTVQLYEEHEVLSQLSIGFYAFAVFVCGRDGIAAIEVPELRNILSFECTESAWVRIERSPRSMYRISANGGRLQYKVGRGVTNILAAASNTELHEICHEVA